ncbi:hypothetical protein GGX14DRAFT_399312 [Mycena pura]|uniref:Uncharacterized protein n=1 Tax=Mycena pura TaxID=153505 RepID=A0AAD6V518_9AGAR|nr:hypothetical protein GGX14DRAFT_399312 [Mycena pura]
MGVHYHSQLDTLERYFKALPASLLESTADSSELEPSTTEVEDYGSVTSAFNRCLEVTFGSRAKGPVQLKFRGACPSPPSRTFSVTSRLIRPPRRRQLQQRRIKGPGSARLLRSSTIWMLWVIKIG